ncbi:Colon cancer-associated protein Mic1-like [Nesidiocoris tenuis]|uniref:Colon cancer-associated protein Mic1-like n=3 Tax=Nesidiocoris tenuis TaxID=355587 RepID=A0ABN7B9L8_9HEMI|nr:Colon cancer-associated protein Mic1-like [Nesidiocoris tenuis]
MNYDGVETAEMADPEGEQEEVIAYDSDHYLRLSMNKITFEGVSKSGLTTVCFDESNTQVFSVLSGDVTEVTVKSPYADKCHKFRMEEKGRVIAMKFSPDQSILALQRTTTSIEFMTVADGLVMRDFTESFKGCVLLGFVWTSKNEIVYVTNLSIKLCKVDMASCSTSSVKNLNLNLINWYNFYSPICLLLLSVGQSGNTFQLLQIKHNQILKISKFDVDIDLKSRKIVSDRDVVLSVVYNQPRILVMNYLAATDGVQTEVVIYTIKKLSEVKKTHVLRINRTGRFALNIVDNLIIVHNQFSKESMVFDITDESSLAVSYHLPDVEPESLKAFEDQPSSSTVSSKVVELYSKNWIIFPPNIVMDVKIGYLWALELNLAGFFERIKDMKKLIKFLLLRSGSKLMITKAITAIAEQPSQLGLLGEIFDQINKNYMSFLQQFVKRQQSLPLTMTQPEDDEVVEFQCVIDQVFMHNQVFCKLAEKLYQDDPKNEDTKGQKVLSWILLEYIRSLADLQIPAQHFIYELLIKMLVITKSFYQLHQLLQYHAVNDSKALACLLLSLENLYPAAPQLALDMLDRLGSGMDEITEILLAKKQVIPCLRYAEQHNGPHDSLVVPSKFLEAARQHGDKRVFHAVKTYFQQNALEDSLNDPGYSQTRAQ